MVAVCALSPSSENCYIAYPSKSSSSAPFSVNHQGSPSYYATGDVEIFDALSLQLLNIVPAHKSPVSCITMNSDGTLLATASEKVALYPCFDICGMQNLSIVLGYRDSCVLYTRWKQALSISTWILSCKDLFDVIQPC